MQPVIDAASSSSLLQTLTHWHQCCMRLLNVSFAVDGHAIDELPRYFVSCDHQVTCADKRLNPS
eukprot:205133-Alexandrium_andersonii.AAC.1